MVYKMLLLAATFFVFSYTESVTNTQEITDSYKSKIVQLADRYNELGRFSGAILIDINNEIVFNQNFGFADHLEKRQFTKETSFKIGSLSKLYVQKILADLIVEQGISLDRKVSSYLKGYSRDLTLEHLLESPLTQATEMDGIKIEVIQKLTERSIDDLLGELSKNLNLSNTHFQPNRNDQAEGHLHINEGNGLEWLASPTLDIDSTSINEGIKSTPTDLLKLINSESIETISLDGYIQKDGFSYSVDRKDNLTIIILSNTRHPVGKEMTQSIKSILSGDNYELPLERKEIVLDSKILKKYQGEYQFNPEMKLKVIVSNDSLFTYMGPRKIHLKAQSENQFFMEETDAAIKFVEDEEKGVTGAIMFDGFLDGNFIERVKE